MYPKGEGYHHLFKNLVKSPTFSREALLADNELKRGGAEEPGPGATVTEHSQVIQDVLFKVTDGRPRDLHWVDVLSDVDRLSLLPVVHLQQRHATSKSVQLSS